MTNSFNPVHPYRVYGCSPPLRWWPRSPSGYFRHPVVIVQSRFIAKGVTSTVRERIRGIAYLQFGQHARFAHQQFIYIGNLFERLPVDREDIVPSLTSTPGSVSGEHSSLLQLAPSGSCRPGSTRSCYLSRTPPKKSHVDLLRLRMLPFCE